MNDIRKMIVDSTTKIMNDMCTKELVNDAEKGIWPADLWQMLKDSGMITVALTEEQGGSGAGLGDALSVLRVAGKYCAPIPLAETFLGNHILSELGMDVFDQPLTIVPFDKEARAKMSIIRRQDGWEVKGQAHWVPWARFADKIIVIGQSDDDTLLAVVETKDCTIKKDQNLAGEARDDVHIDHVRIDDACVAKINSDESLHKLWHTGALTRVALMTGALERVLELTLAYSLERSQFGRPISRFQAIQHHIANVSGEVAAAGIACDYAIQSIESNPLAMDIALAKIRVGEAASIVAPIAHQVHGAIGFTDEHVLHQSTRRLWSWRDEFGSESEWAENVGREFIEKGPDKLWDMIVSHS